MRQLKHTVSRWPLRKAFVISRGSRTEAEVIQVMIMDGEHQGFAECVPYARYDESCDSVIAEIESVTHAISDGASRRDIQKLMSPGAARNAIDCALWDLEAKQIGQTVGSMSGLGDPAELISAQTISIGTEAEMAAEAQQFARYPLLKVKLDSENIIPRIAAIHANAPASNIIIDANEAWSIAELNQHWQSLQDMAVMLIEQPLPASNDHELIRYQGDIPICADESCHSSADIDALAERYHAINIKLDKTGGLTEAINTYHAARKHQLQIMVGCMVGTSLAMAPATLLAQHAEVVDLDGPALLAEDVAHGFQFHHGHMSALTEQLWGGAR